MEKHQHNDPNEVGEPNAQQQLPRTNQEGQAINSKNTNTKGNE